MGFLVFCNTDVEGNITDFIAGQAVIPEKQYDHFFYLLNPIEAADYKVENGELVLK